MNNLIYVALSNSLYIACNYDDRIRYVDKLFKSIISTMSLIRNIKACFQFNYHNDWSMSSRR